LADRTAANGEGRGEFAEVPLAHARALASHHVFVRSLARGLVGPEGFEDVAQETLLAGLERRPSHEGALRGWLAATARNIAGKFHRGKARRRRRELAAAQPEALPSSHELVERIELEQAVVRAVLALREPQRSAVLLRFYEGHPTAAIAQRLQVPADTVRARLRRGLAELRAQLDARFGRREEWVAALLPVAGIPTGILGPGLAKAGVAAGTTGAAVMGAKAITVLTAACATAFVAWWVLPERFYGHRSDPAVASSAANGRRGAAANGERPLPAPVSAGANRLAATREVDPNEPNDPAAAPAAAAAATLPPPGSVRFEVVDARTLKPLESVKVHFLHEQRFADYEAGGAVDVKLTSGRWEANVAAPGHEPARLDGFEVKVGETANLGRVALERGNSVVEGRVVAHHLAADKPVVVELFGDGRSPCDHCLDRRAHATDESQNVEVGGDCGWREDRDLLQITGDRSFRFTSLAAGVYWLRACDPEQRIVEAVRLEVGRGGSLWRELDVSAPTLARFELRHESGGRFSGAWSSIHQANPAAIRYAFKVNRNGAAGSGSREVGSVERTPDVDQTLDSVGLPIAIPGREPPAASALRAGQVLQLRWLVSAVQRNATDRGTQSWFSVLNRVDSEAERIDRERQEGDALGFDLGAPDCDGVQLKIKALRAGQDEIGPLPRAELTVVVSCGDYSSDEVPLDLRGDLFQPLVVTMKLRKEIAERLPEIRKGPPASCVACHGAESPGDGKVVYEAPAQTIDFDADGSTGAVIQLRSGDLKASEITLDLGSALQQALQSAGAQNETNASPEGAPAKDDH
jgi:RNA polymerase sigma-70 factor (ECF subfamily)